MAVQLTPALEQRLHHLATQQQRTLDEIANDAISSYLEYQAALAADVREGEESAEQEGWLDHDEVVRRISGDLQKTA